MKNSFVKIFNHVSINENILIKQLYITNQKIYTTVRDLMKLIKLIKTN